jgi:hypothetical protein
VALPRLRQAVVAAVDLDATMAAIESELGASAPFHDEGVGHFGLRNAVYTIGDTFLEVVSPVRDGTAAGRQIERAGGDCGYMCMFELGDEDEVRARLADVSARIVHDGRRDDIVDIHLHPKDVPGAIVALDVCRPPGSWRWGGPAWEGTIPSHDAGGLRGLVVAVHDVDRAVSVWARLLDVQPADGVLTLDGGAQQVRFVAAGPDEAERIVEVSLAVADRGGEVTIAGTRFMRERI